MYNVQFPGMGISMTIDPVAFSIGDFKVYWYGIVIGIGFALALFFALKNLRRFGIKPYYRCSYKAAVKQGWAPAPTNEVQKAIWDAVKARKNGGKAGGK